MTPQYKVTDFIGTSPLGPLYLRNTSIQGTKILVHECWHFYLCICYLFLKGHLHGVGGGGALKGRLSRGVPTKPSKSPNPVENKSAVDRFVLPWQLIEIPWGKQLSEDLTTEEVATVLRFFSRRHVSDQCDSREMILHYDKRENMIRAISDTDRTTSQDTQISCEIYMCVVEFFTSQKCLIWKEPFRWVNNSLLITVLIRISAQPRISVHLE